MPHTNESRASFALAAVECHADLSDGVDELEAMISDLLTNLMHLAKLEVLDWHRINHRASLHFEFEEGDLDEG